MDYIKIVAGLCVVIAALVAVAKFNRYAVDRFGHRFFGVPTLLAGAAAAWAIAIGASWAKTSMAGLVLAAAGVAVLVLVIVSNVRRTSVGVGAAGSAIQIGAFAMVGIAGMLAIPVAFFLLVMGAAGAPLRRDRYAYDNDYDD